MTFKEGDPWFDFEVLLIRDGDYNLMVRIRDPANLKLRIEIDSDNASMPDGSDGRAFIDYSLPEGLDSIYVKN